VAATLLQGQFNQDAQIQKNILGQGQNQDSAIQGQLAQDQQNQDAQIQNQLNGKKRHLMSFLPNINNDFNNQVRDDSAAFACFSDFAHIYYIVPVLFCKMQLGKP